MPSPWAALTPAAAGLGTGRGLSRLSVGTPASAAAGDRRGTARVRLQATACQLSARVGNCKRAPLMSCLLPARWSECGTPNRCDCPAHWFVTLHAFCTILRASRQASPMHSQWVCPKLGKHHSRWCLPTLPACHGWGHHDVVLPTAHISWAVAGSCGLACCAMPPWNQPVPTSDAHSWSLQRARSSLGPLRRGPDENAPVAANSAAAQERSQPDAWSQVCCPETACESGTDIAAWTQHQRSACRSTASLLLREMTVKAALLLNQA